MTGRRGHRGQPLFAALLAACIPGAGQAYEGRTAAAALLFAPAALLALGVGLVAGAATLPEIAGSFVLPSTLGLLLVANLAIFAWWVLAIVDAWWGGRRGHTSALSVCALVAILVVASLPHLLVGSPLTHLTQTGSPPVDQVPRG